VNLAHYLGLLHRAEADLAAGLRDVAAGHADEADVHHLAGRLAAECDRHAEQLAPFVERYGEVASDEPDLLRALAFPGSREGGLGLLRDLQDLYLLATECDISWTLLGQAAQGLRDEALLDVVRACEQETAMQLRWLRTRLKQSAPQALVVA
jgi:hypothetical protein